MIWSRLECCAYLIMIHASLTKKMSLLKSSWRCLEQVKQWRPAHIFVALIQRPASHTHHNYESVLVSGFAMPFFGNYFNNL